MKKIIFLLFTIAIMTSCEKEGSEELETADFSFSSCTYQNANRFTQTHCTYGANLCSNGEPDFAFGLEKNILAEINFPSILNSRPNSTTQISSHYIDDLITNLSNINPSVNLYPTISVSDANIVYRGVSCEIKDEIDLLPSLPSNEYYVIIIDSLYIQFSFGGPTAQFTEIQLSYRIEKWTY